MQQIIQHLFRVQSLEEVPRERLEELVATYPSFGMGRYLLSRKLHTEDAGHFSEETQKTNLYFSNPFWLHWLLQNEDSVQQPAYSLETPPANVLAEETMIEDEQSWGMPDIPLAEASTITEEETRPVLVEEPGVAEELADTPPSAADTLLQSLEEARGLRQALVQMNEEEPPHANEEVSSQVSIVGGNAISSLEHIFAPGEAGAEEDNSGGVVSIAESRVEEAALPEESQSPAPEEQLVTGEPPALPAAEIPEIQVAASVHDDAAQQPVIHAPQELPVSPTLETSVEAAVSAAAVTAQAAAPAEQIVVFEPYHTIDYFASVGIKLTQEENPSDKLGKQLKSFTEWLKVMRKLPQKNQEIIPDVAVEHQIQAIAAHSITGKDVLTETMAEVLVKQGMREKAVDVYHKLSLLNPEKSAYFATKIEQLKID